MSKKFVQTLLILIMFFIISPVAAQQQVKLRKKDRKRDVEMVTTMGTIVLRLSDSTPLHRDNFLRLVKSDFYDSVLFHRVIQFFMIQAGDPNTRRLLPGTKAGEGGPGYTVPAEIRPGLFHKKGALAAARTSDEVNPLKASSGSQFYLVQGKVFTDAGLDSVETFRLKGKKLPETHRQVYKTVGGSPHLDQNYTVFGEIVSGLQVVDSIAAVPTSGRPEDKPKTDVRIVHMKLIKRKNYQR